MGRIKGGNRNTNDEAVVTRIPVDSVTPVVLSASNPDRMYFSVCLAPDVVDVDLAVRCYPAVDDTNVDGVILTRKVTGNDGFFRPSWTMPPESPYTGEISALSMNGTHDVIVTEW